MVGIRRSVRVLLGVGLWAGSLSVRAIDVGSTRSDVLAELGEPELQFTRGEKQTLMYYGLEIDFINGVVVRVPPNLAQQLERRRRQRTSDLAAMEEARRKAAEAKRLMAGQSVSRDRSPARGVSSAGSVQVVSNGGNRVDLNQFIGGGKVTIVDFYADWCGPCRRIGPALANLAGQDPDVRLVKIDIVNWNTPVAKQYRLRSIPHIRVYNAAGRPVGQPTSSLSAVQHYLAQAK